MKHKNRRTPWALALALALLLALSAPLLALAKNWDVEDYDDFIYAASSCAAGDVIILKNDIARSSSQGTAQITVDNVTVKSYGNNTFEIKNEETATGRLLEVTGDAFTMDHIAMSGGSTIAGSTAGAGGALYATQDATLSHCKFTDNQTEGLYASGGAVYIAGHATVKNSTFTDNYTMGDNAQGGALYAGDGATITESTFSENHTEGDDARGGGAYIWGEATITESTFSENHTEGDRSSGGGAIIAGDATITESTFSENHTEGDRSSAGGVSISGKATITESTFSDNHTEGDNAPGGGAYISHGATITDSTFVNNYTEGGAASGGGAYIAGDVIITDSTFEGNESHQSYGGGLSYGILWLGDTLALKETDFYNNTSATGGGAITNESATDTIFYGTNYFAGNDPEGSQLHGIDSPSPINFAPGARIVEGRRPTESEAEPAGGNVASLYLVTKNTTLYADAEKTTLLRNLSAGKKVSVRYIISGMAYTPDGFIPFDALKFAP